jgi:hypothetical protein
MRRGQFIIEFTILLALAVLAGIIYLVSATSLLGDVSEQQRVTALNDVGYMVQDEVLLAETVDDGYLRTFTIPQTADRFAYQLTSDETSITLASGSTIITYPLPLVSGTFQKGKNTIAKNGAITVMPG